MNSEKLKYYIIPILICIITLVIIFTLVPRLALNVKTYMSTRREIAAKTEELQQKQDQLEQYKKDEAEKKAKESETRTAGKPFYKPIEAGLDAESVITGEFTEILQLIRANQIKVRSISYDYNPDDDVFVKSAADKYNVARLNMEMIGTYTNYDNFLKEMYKHEHFLDIQSVEIVPYKKNKKILLINCKVKLYAQK